MKEIYKKVDGSLRRKKGKLVAFAQHNDCKYYSEYIHKTLQENSAVSIIKSMKEYGISKPPCTNSIYGTKHRVLSLIADGAKGEDVKICNQCNKRPITPPDHAICKKCQKSGHETEYYGNVRFQN